MPGIQGAIGGASAGSFLGPIGTIAGGLLGAFVGGGQKKKANKWLANNPYPIESLPTEITENQNSARRMAAEGLPSEQYAQAMKNIQRQQLVAIRGAQDRRGGLGSIAGIQQGTNDATLNLDAMDAQARMANERQLMGVNNQTAGWKSQLFDKNIRQKYNRDYEYNMGMKGAGNQNLTGGIDKVLAGLFGSQAYGDGYGGGLLGGRNKRSGGSMFDDSFSSGSYGGSADYGTSHPVIIQ